MPTNNTRTKTAAAAPEPKRNAAQDPESLLMAALQAMAAAEAKTGTTRRTAQSTSETLAQPLTDRDRAALARAGWTGRLSSPKPADPKPLAKPKNGPSFKSSSLPEMSPERRNASIFWAGLCSTLSRNNGRIWLPEVAAVICQLQVTGLDNPSKLSNRLTYLTGTTSQRPSNEAGWLICNLEGEMTGAQIWAQLWNAHLQQFTDAIAAGD